MPTIFQLDSMNIATGASREIGFDEGCPVGWTRTEIPAVTVGQFVRVIGGSVEILDAYPPLSTSPVPQIVSKFQAKAALLNAGYLSAVDTIMADPATPDLARLAWTEAQEFVRASPTVAGMAAALSLTNEQVDDLFRYAATVTA